MNKNRNPLVVGISVLKSHTPSASVASVAEPPFGSPPPPKEHLGGLPPDQEEEDREDDGHLQN